MLKHPILNIPPIYKFRHLRQALRSISMSSNKTASLFSAFTTLPHIQRRLEIFESIRARQLKRLEALTGDITVSVVISSPSSTDKKSSSDIIKDPHYGKNGDCSAVKVVVGAKGKITPFEAALRTDPALAKNAVVCKVDGVAWDLNRPLQRDCSVELLGADSKEGMHTFWHSSAHALGECLEILYEGKLTIGPALETGFYYDADIGERRLSEEDYADIEQTLSLITTQNQPFERVDLTREEALDLFSDNEYKCQLIREKVGDGAETSAYRCGGLVDLCRGPHLAGTGKIKAFKTVNHSMCYWKGESDNKQLQRVYGLSYPTSKQLKLKLKEIELCKERDHRKLGKDQNLFFFHHLSPGSAFWTPYGTKIYNGLVDYIKSEYRKRGYSEVISPNVYNMDLWKVSGHADKYKKNMFTFSIENQEFGMKPMNCPGHCLMFKHKVVSYRDLPLRMADFGVLHRNELTGALSGLSRVRRFCQDDAHIFCAVESINDEVQNCLSFVKDVYSVFRFDFSLALSTRPAEYIGDRAVWENAEAALREALDAFGVEWELNEGDGAFYGPKIDVMLKDALGRSIQCATIQLDFNLPSEERFDLSYSDAAGSLSRPVMIHRAILGSVERFVATLAEHCGGKWPFWLSPRQIKVVPVSEKFIDFGLKLQQSLYAQGFEAELDASDNKVQKKIRTAQLEQFNVTLVVGAKEVESGVFVVRYRGHSALAQKTMPELLAEFQRWVAEKTFDK